MIEKAPVCQLSYGAKCKEEACVLKPEDLLDAEIAFCGRSSLSLADVSKHSSLSELDNFGTSSRRGKLFHVGLNVSLLDFWVGIR